MGIIEFPGELTPPDTDVVDLAVRAADTTTTTNITTTTGGGGTGSTMTTGTTTKSSSICNENDGNNSTGETTPARHVVQDELQHDDQHGCVSGLVILEKKASKS